MKFREATPADADALTQLALRSKRAWGYDEEFMQRVMPDMIVHPDVLFSERGIIAEDGRSVLGYAIVRVDGREAHVRDLFIEPAYFRQGIGKALFTEAVRYARKRGAKTIALQGDPHAVGFYKRMGMRQIGSEPSIAGGGRMLPAMLLDLER
jgi:ribosomal protein S18 acetylase RimI-like enzyme